MLKLKTRYVRTTASRTKPRPQTTLLKRIASRKSAEGCQRLFTHSNLAGSLPAMKYLAKRKPSGRGSGFETMNASPIAAVMNDSRSKYSRGSPPSATSANRQAHRKQYEPGQE